MVPYVIIFGQCASSKTCEISSLVLKKVASLLRKPGNLKQLFPDSELLFFLGKSETAVKVSFLRDFFEEPKTAVNVCVLKFLSVFVTLKGLFLTTAIKVVGKLILLKLKAYFCRDIFLFTT